MNQNRRLKKGGKNHQRKNNNKKNDGVLINPMDYSTSLGHQIVPDRTIVTLKWNFLTGSANFSVLSLAVYPLCGNNAYDVDPAIGGSSMGGFTELAALYNFYRGIRSRVRVEFSGISSTTPVICTVVPTVLSALSSNLQMTSAPFNAYAVRKSSGLLGGPKTVVTHEMSTDKIFGRKTEFDSPFRAYTNGGPLTSGQWFWNIVFQTPQLIASLVFDFQIFYEMDIEFSGRAFKLV
jgi:hypothetical protein